MSFDAIGKIGATAVGIAGTLAVTKIATDTITKGTKGLKTKGVSKSQVYGNTYKTKSRKSKIF